MTEMDVYLWTRLDEIREIFNLAGALSAVVLLIAILGQYLYGAIAEEDCVACLQKLTKKVALVFAVSCMGCIAIPNSKDYAMIKILPKIANSKAMQVDAPELYDLAIKALKQKLGTELTLERIK